jgi:hypothetical protein
MAQSADGAMRGDCVHPPQQFGTASIAGPEPEWWRRQQLFMPARLQQGDAVLAAKTVCSSGADGRRRSEHTISRAMSRRMIA